MKFIESFKGVFSGIVAAYINSALGLTVNLVQAALAVRFLPHNEAGIWILFLSLLVFLGLSDLGLSATLSRFVSFAQHVSSKHLRTGLFFKAAKRTNLWMTSVVLTCAVIFFIYILFYKQKLISTEIILSLFLFLLAIYFRLMSNPNMALIFGLKQVVLQYRLRSITQITSLIILVVLCYIKPLLINFSISVLAQYLLLYALSRYFANKQLILKKVKFSKPHFKNLMDKSVRLFLVGAGAYLIYDINIPLLSFYVSLPEITQFGILLQVINLLGIMSLITQSTVSPFVSSLFAQGEYSSLRTFVFASLKFNMFIAITVCTFLFYYSDLFFHLWLGSQFILNRPLFLLFLIILVFQVQDASIANIATACGYLNFFWITCLSGILNISLLVLLAPKWGILGAGISMLTAQILTNNWYSIYVLCKPLSIGIAFKSFFKIYLLRLILFCLMLLGVSYFMRELKIFESLPLAGFLTGGLLTLMISSILMLLFLLSQSERTHLFKLVFSKIKLQDKGLSHG
jgi:O-antigen/teichoic acid export membrane protein